MSVTDLAGQFAAAIETATAEHRLPLHRLGGWLVMADWLARRPQLGREVFGRGRAEAPDGADHATPAADVTALLRACLAVLERLGQGVPYRLEPLLLWRVPEAMAQLRRMLPTLPVGAALECFLPPATDAGPDVPL